MEGSSEQHSNSPTAFRQWFVRGLAILLPSVLTIWILLAAWQFVHNRIAEPINAGVREVVVRATWWPAVSEEQVDEHIGEIVRRGGSQIRGELFDTVEDAEQRRRIREIGEESVQVAELRNHDAVRAWAEIDLKRRYLQSWWSDWYFFMDLIGLVIAIVLIYMAGLLLGSYIGRRLYARGEAIVNQVPLVGRVYPAVKQVTDFFVGQGRSKVSFNRVVAVQYPRKGLWSVGLVTGDTMQAIQDEAGQECMTVFVPSSPTPFTGYVITVPKVDTIDLPITVEDAMKFAVSGGVLVPPNQQIRRSEAGPPAVGEAHGGAALPGGEAEAESTSTARGVN